MNNLKKFLKKIPLLPTVYRFLVDSYIRYNRRFKTTEEIFTEIKEKRHWRGKESVSGVGSDASQTKLISEKIPALLTELKVSKMLDIPCGDFYWMKNVKLGEVNYIGADIVADLIAKNNEEFSADRIQFQKLDLTVDELPQVDLVFCRDCLVHLSFEKIFLSLENICNSGSEFLLTTTFCDKQTNRDIVTGQWRALNLEVAPFFLPKPVELIYEQFVEGDGTFDDKALALWKIADIRIALQQSEKVKSH